MCPAKGNLCCPSSPVGISAAHTREMLGAGHGTGRPCNGLAKLEQEEQDVVLSCHLSAWAGVSAECCWAPSASWWHQLCEDILPSFLVAFSRDCGARAGQ